MQVKDRITRFWRKHDQWELNGEFENMDYGK
jgi:hypothetical protein